MRLFVLYFILLLCLVVKPAYPQPGDAIDPDPNLENYSCSFAVNVIPVYQQLQPVCMAYRDVIPQKVNGNVVHKGNYRLHVRFCYQIIPGSSCHLSNVSTTSSLHCDLL